MLILITPDKDPHLSVKVHNLFMLKKTAHLELDQVQIMTFSNNFT